MKKKMNIPLLRKIQRNLLIQSITPEICRFNMNFYCIPAKRVDCGQRPKCNTLACIAGEALIISGKAKWSKISQSYVFKGGNEAIKAAEILGLSPIQAGNLFYFKSWDRNVKGVSVGWNEDIASEYQNAYPETQKALIGSKRIEQFIQSRGKI